MTAGNEPPLAVLIADARHLRTLEQLRAASTAAPVLVVRNGTDGRVHVWQAPAGQFLQGVDGRWIYEDELGRRWDKRTHDRVGRHIGRLPYSHTVMTPDEVRKLSRLHYLRPPLTRPVIDDRAEARRKRTRSER